MPRAGRRRKKSRTHKADPNESSTTAPQSALVSSEELKVPKSLVIRRGKVEHEVIELVDDLRKLMLPYTALHFNEDAKNTKLTLSHYARELAMPMGVSHILSFTQNAERLNLRIARVPEGPTLTFRVTKFSLSRHVKAIQKRPYNSPGAHQQPPIVVTNNFGDAHAAPHVKLMRITFQNMFPAINVATVKLADCRRVVLFHLLDQADPDDKTMQLVEMRHYAIKATPVGINKKVRRLIQTKVPNLHRLDDIAEYLVGQNNNATTGSSVASDSEPEEDETSHVVLPQKYSGRGNVAHQKSALKLVELGPRLCLRLYKVERGLGGGDVMYHAHVTKSAEQVRELKERKQHEVELKRQRREEQERNVARKRQDEEEKRQAKRQRREEREKVAMEELRRGAAGSAASSDNKQEEAESVESSNEEEPEEEEMREEEGEESEDDESSKEV